jgi:hypothetical protein
MKMKALHSEWLRQLDTSDNPKLRSIPCKYDKRFKELVKLLRCEHSTLDAHRIWFLTVPDADKHFLGYELHEMGMVQMAALLLLGSLALE